MGIYYAVFMDGETQYFIKVGSQCTASCLQCPRISVKPGLCCKFQGSLCQLHNENPVLNFSPTTYHPPPCQKKKETKLIQRDSRPRKLYHICRFTEQQYQSIVLLPVQTDSGTEWNHRVLACDTDSINQQRENKVIIKKLGVERRCKEAEQLGAFPAMSPW